MELVQFVVYIALLVGLWQLFQFSLSPEPKPAWKGRFLAASMVTMIALSRLARTGSFDTWSGSFLIFGLVMMIVSAVWLRPRDEEFR